MFHTSSHLHTRPLTCGLIHSPSRQHTLTCALPHCFLCHVLMPVIYLSLEPSLRMYHGPGNLEIRETHGPCPSPKGVYSLEENQILRLTSRLHCLMYQETCSRKSPCKLMRLPRRGQRTFSWEQSGLFHELGLQGRQGVLYTHGPSRWGSMYQSREVGRH